MQGGRESEGGKGRLREGDTDLSFHLLFIRWLLLECALKGDQHAALAYREDSNQLSYPARAHQVYFFKKPTNFIQL